MAQTPKPRHCAAEASYWCEREVLSPVTAVVGSGAYKRVAKVQDILGLKFCLHRWIQRCNIKKKTTCAGLDIIKRSTKTDNEICRNRYRWNCRQTLRHSSVLQPWLRQWGQYVLLRRSSNRLELGFTGRCIRAFRSQLGLGRALRIWRLRLTAHRATATTVGTRYPPRARGRGGAMIGGGGIGSEARVNRQLKRVVLRLRCLLVQRHCRQHLCRAILVRWKKVHGLQRMVTLLHRQHVREALRRWQRRKRQQRRAPLE